MGSEISKAETRATAGWALDRILQLLHPFMPFVTEELWQHMGAREAMLIESNWPDLSADLIDPAVESEMDWVVRLISEVRAVRAEMNVPVKAEIGLWLNGAGEENLRRLRANEEAIIRLARLEVIQQEDQEVPTGAVQIVFDEATIVLPLAKVIDIEREKVRLARELEKARGEIASFDEKLNNECFLAKAPEHVIEEQHERRRDALSTELRLTAALERL